MARKAAADLAKPASPPKRKKSEATREHVFETALALFRKQGVDETTMRDIAAAAGLALGAAYYYFPNKDAIVAALWQRNHERFGALARAAMDGKRDPAARLAAVLHAATETVRRDRKLMAPMVGVLIDPRQPMSVLSPETAQLRQHSADLLLTAIEDVPLDGKARPFVAQLLLLLHFAVLLYFVHDKSRGQERTAELIENAAKLVLPLLLLAGSPLGAPLLAQVEHTLTAAGLDGLLLPPTKRA